jgi:glutathione S-transferase
MEYLRVNEARGIPGLKLVLSVAVPGPWGEGIKKILEYKGLHYLPVAQFPSEENADLKRWTGVRNAPVLITDDGTVAHRWLDLVLLAERLQPEPAILPQDSIERALVVGILNELCGEWGFGWCRRLLTLEALGGLPEPTGTATIDPLWALILAEYKVTRAALAAAPARLADILRMLGARLREQKAEGSPYIVGRLLTAADIYWACFSLQVDPLPHDVNPMLDHHRQAYTMKHPQVLAALDPLLIAHRDYIFKHHLRLPLDF